MRSTGALSVGTMNTADRAHAGALYRFVRNEVDEENGSCVCPEAGRSRTSGTSPVSSSGRAGVERWPDGARRQELGVADERVDSESIRAASAPAYERPPAVMFVLFDGIPAVATLKNRPGRPVRRRLTPTGTVSFGDCRRAMRRRRTTSRAIRWSTCRSAGSR
jgi:hypothetical protein